MAQTLSGLQTVVPLTELSLKIRNEESNYAALKIFPIKRRAKASGKIRVYGKDNMRVLPYTAFNRRASAPEIDRTYSTMSFACEKVRVKELILDTDVRDADADIADIRMDSTQDLTEQQLLTLENTMITKAFTAGNFASGFTGAGTDWDGAGNPISDVITAKEAVRIGLGGVEADSIAMDVARFNALLTNAKIIERLVSVMGPTALVNEQNILALFGLKNLIKIGAVANTATKDSAGTATLAALGTSTTGSKALVFKMADTNMLRTNGFGCTLIPSGGDLGIRSWRSNDPEGEWLESSWEYALQFLSVDTAASGKSAGGFLITGL